MQADIPRAVRGRRPIAEADRRTSPVTVFFRVTERAKIVEVAARRGESLSSTVRRLVLAALGA